MRGIYLAFALLLFFSFFTLVPLPGSTKAVQNAFLEAEWMIYRLSRASGTVTDDAMCVLADLWGMGGLTAEYITPGGQRENVTCALLTESKVAITPDDVGEMGSELRGEVTDIWITSRYQVTKIFFFSYFLMGLVIMGLLMDMFSSIGPFSHRTAFSAAGLFTISVGITTVMFRSGIIGGIRSWELLNWGVGLAPGTGMLSYLLTIFLALAIVGYIAGGVMRGYNIAKEYINTYEALKLSTRIEKEKGEKAMQAAKELQRKA